MPSSSSSRWGVPVVVALVALAAGAIGYLVWIRSAPIGGGTGLPEPGSSVYEQYAEAFEVGLAALDAGVPQIAQENLTRAVELVPEEPAGWADRGLHHLRSGRLPEAAQDLDRAQVLAPGNADVQKLMGLVEQRSGNYGEAMAHLRRALESDPADVKVLFLLAQVVDQERGEGSDAEHHRLMEKILQIQPDNLHVLADRLRAAVRRSDAETVRDTLGRLRRLAPGWNEETRKALDDVEKHLAGKLGPSAVHAVLRFGNLLRSAPSYARDAEAVNPDKMPGDPLRAFVRLAPARHTPAALDEELGFTAEPLPDVPEGRWDLALPVWTTGEGQATVLVASAEHVFLTGAEAPLPGLPVTADGLVPIDWNNDKRMDLLLAGNGGLRFFQQQDDGSFADVTSKTELADEIVQGDYHAALADDVDLDGDVDLLVSRAGGAPWFLRNNFDGTFKALPIFEELTGPQKFAWADFDRDGAPDAALLDGDGKLHLFANERSAKFIAWPAAPPDGRYLAMTVADTNDDGVLDLIALGEDGGIIRVSDRDKRTAWDTSEIATWKQVDGEPLTAARLSAADLDNNGVVDLLASTAERSAIWLGAGADRFVAPRAELPPRIFAAADLRGEGRLDLIGLDADGRPTRLVNRGTKDYHWQNIRPRATEEKSEGDNRINSFGIGGEVEVRTGTHVAKQPINAPVVHFGLGERPRSDVVRIEWPNGTFQAEFSLPIDKAVTAVQRLKGSCPFLFAWNGERFAFVSDFMWSTPLGMYINASDKGGFLQTTDWVKIPGDELVARDGLYELRVNASLWETHFFDQLALVAVDHPDDTELYVDERFFMEPTEPSWHLMEPLRGVAGAWDQRGETAIDELRAVDGVHLDRCGRGTYQGVTNEHWVEVDLGDDAPSEGPVWLVARGWVHPTDSSVNYALEQGRHASPHGLVLEIPDGQGGWRIARDRIGFPAGKNKTVVIRLDGLHGPGVARRFRLRTNMEIYWDTIQYARGRDDAQVRPHRLQNTEADLSFRGVLAIRQANRSSPELPDYDEVVSHGQYWRDLIGYHTRYGEISELLAQGDDRYAILCAGDEIVLRFTAPADPPLGWRRDFVWISDGWVKDGDYNTRFGKTVLPLPAHDRASYDVPPGRLEDDLVYQRHTNDWETYHTRYVTPYWFEQGLRGGSRARHGVEGRR